MPQLITPTQLKNSLKQAALILTISTLLALAATLAQLKTTSQQTSPTLDTSNWQTYTNTKHSFQLSLSNAWKGYRVQEVSVGINKDVDVVTFEIPCPTNPIVDKSSPWCSPFYIQIHPADKPPTFQQDNIHVVAKNEAHIFVAIVNDPSSDPRFPNIDFNIPAILSTFRFIEQPQTDNLEPNPATDTWKTYTYENIQFKYPSTWPSPQITQYSTPSAPGPTEIFFPQLSIILHNRKQPTPITLKEYLNSATQPKATSLTDYFTSTLSGKKWLADNGRYQIALGESENTIQFFSLSYLPQASSQVDQILSTFRFLD
jgi:hypothetical protein